MSLPFTFGDQNFVCIFRFSYVRYLLRQSYSPSFDILMLFCEVKFCSSPLSGFLRFGFRYSPLATVLPNALCLLSSLDVRNQSSVPYKWVFMCGMERRYSEHLVLLLWFLNFWPCQHFEVFTGFLFLSCLMVAGREAVFIAACYVRAYRHARSHTHMDRHIGVVF